MKHVLRLFSGTTHVRRDRPAVFQIADLKTRTTDREPLSNTYPALPAHLQSTQPVAHPFHAHVSPDHIQKALQHNPLPA